MEIADYDLIIAGAGPAGSACAITAVRAGARVLLLEKDRFPRQKVCGEFVSAESLGLLGKLLGKAPSAHEWVTGARFFVDRKCVRLPLSPAAQSIPRYEMDAALFEAAHNAGADTLQEVPVLKVERQQVFKVVTPKKTFSAKAVVNASGRWSRLTQFDVVEKQKWLGLKAHFTELQPPASVDMYFFSGGYCGVTPVDARTVNVCAMVRSEVAHSFDQLFSKHPGLRRRSQDWRQLFPTITTSPLLFREPQTEADGMLLVGDAAGFIDPFAGDGISLALHSGQLAAETLLPFIRGERSLEQAYNQYRAAYEKRFVPAFRNAVRLRTALAAPRWLRTVAMSMAGIPGVGKMLVRSTRAK